LGKKKKAFWCASEFKLFIKYYWGNQIKEDYMGGELVLFCHPHNMK